MMKTGKIVIFQFCIDFKSLKTLRSFLFFAVLLRRQFDLSLVENEQDELRGSWSQPHRAGPSRDWVA